MTWTIRLPYSTPPISLNSRMHWATANRIKSEVAYHVTIGVRRARIPACGAIHVQLGYVPRDKRTRDPDNLMLLHKICVDAIRRAGVVLDDSPEYVTWSPPRIDPPDRNDPHLYVTIERKT